MNNDYDQNASGWYAPMAPAPTARTGLEEPAPRKRKMPLGWQIVLNTLLALDLVVNILQFLRYSCRVILFVK